MKDELMTWNGQLLPLSWDRLINRVIKVIRYINKKLAIPIYFTY